MCGQAAAADAAAASVTIPGLYGHTPTTLDSFASSNGGVARGWSFGNSAAQRAAFFGAPPQPPRQQQPPQPQTEQQSTRLPFGNWRGRDPNPPPTAPFRDPWTEHWVNTDTDEWSNFGGSDEDGATAASQHE
jgi:hypothetical protein